MWRPARVWLLSKAGMNAGPSIVLRQSDHTGPHRIEFDIPQAPQQIVIYQRMAENRFPQVVRDLDSPSVWWVESEIDVWIQARMMRGTLRPSPDPSASI